MTEPHGVHELTVFIVPAYLGPVAATAVDEVVAHGRGEHAAFAWLAVDSRVRALHPPAGDVSGAALAGHCAALEPERANLTEAFAMAVDLARQYLAAHDDGPSPVVDILAVVDSRCTLIVGEWAASLSGSALQAGAVLHDYPGAERLPAAVHRLAADDLTRLGLMWTLLRYRCRALRRDRLVPESRSGGTES